MRAEMEQIEVHCCSVIVVRDPDGTFTFEAQAQDWLSLLDDDEVAGTLHAAARAVALLANSFGKPDDDDGSRVVRLVKDDMAPPEAD